MAKNVTVVLVDDLDSEKEADETIEFAVDDITYEIDLTSRNADKLRNTVAKWSEHARRVNSAKPTRGTQTKTMISQVMADKAMTPIIRDWARDEGYEVASRGRVPASIVDAYRKAH